MHRSHVEVVVNGCHLEPCQLGLVVQNHLRSTPHLLTIHLISAFRYPLDWYQLLPEELDVKLALCNPPQHHRCTQTLSPACSLQT